MVVSNAKVSLGNRDTAVSTKAEFDTGITARRVRTDEFISMLNIAWDYKVSFLELMIIWHSARATREHHSRGLCLISGGGW
jgi:hypothetical protein